MITSFEVGSVFRIIDEASPALRKILLQVRELNKVITTARENLASLGGSFSNLKLGTAVGETEGLATAWGNVAKNAEAARLALGSASTAAGRASAAGAVGGGRSGGNRGLFRPGHRGGGLHGPGMVAVGGVAWAVDQAANTEDAAWQLTRHAHLEQTEANHARFRKILQDAQIRDGFRVWTQ